MSELDPFFGTSGPRDAEIVGVAESWGREEEVAKLPLVGQSGQELTRILSEGGLDRSKIFLTNVVSARPQNNDMWQFFDEAKTATGPVIRGLHPTPLVLQGLDALHKQLDAIRPKVILAFGNYALWALTNCCWTNASSYSTGNRRTPGGIESWRGSMWRCDALPSPLNETKIIPLIHPAAIMREWVKRSITIHDLRARVPMALRGDWRPFPKPVTLAPPTYDQVIRRLDHWLNRAKEGPFRLVCDIETARRSFISCIGFCASLDFAMAIPFVRLTDKRGFESYWTPEQEHEIVKRIRKILSHPNIQIEGQNFLYDIQYLLQELGILSTLDFDSMLAHHLLFPGTPKGLDYLSSLYCKYHWYWKDDAKEWDLHGTLEQHLEYNCLDTLRTYEVVTALRELISKMGLESQWSEQKEFNNLALEMMLRGVKIDAKRRGDLALELATASTNMALWFESIAPQSIVAPKADTPWYNSPKQQRDYFGDQLGLQLPRDRKTGRPTFGHEALATLKARHPEFTRLFNAIEQYRSIRVFHKTFVAAPLDPGDRMRCMFNTSGTETFRWSSSENAFGRGTNLQNIPKGEED